MVFSSKYHRRDIAIQKDMHLHFMRGSQKRRAWTILGFAKSVSSINNHTFLTNIKCPRPSNPFLSLIAIQSSKVTDWQTVTSRHTMTDQTQ